MRGMEMSERCANVFNQYGGALESDRKTYKAVWHALRIEICEVAPAIRRNDNTLDTAPAHTDAESLQSIDEPPHIVEAAVSKRKAEQPGITCKR